MSETRLEGHVHVKFQGSSPELAIANSPTMCLFYIIVFWKQELLILYCAFSKSTYIITDIYSIYIYVCVYVCIYIITVLSFLRFIMCFQEYPFIKSRFPGMSLYSMFFVTNDWYDYCVVEMWILSFRFCFSISVIVCLMYWSRGGAHSCTHTHKHTLTHHLINKVKSIDCSVLHISTHAHTHTQEDYSQSVQFICCGNVCVWVSDCAYVDSIKCVWLCLYVSAMLIMSIYLSLFICLYMCVCLSVCIFVCVCVFTCL